MTDVSLSTLSDDMLLPPPPPKRSRLVDPLQDLPDMVARIIDTFANSRRQRPEFEAFAAKYGDCVHADG